MDSHCHFILQRAKKDRYLFAPEESLLRELIDLPYFYLVIFSSFLGRGPKVKWRTVLFFDIWLTDRIGFVSFFLKNAFDQVHLKINIWHGHESVWGNKGKCIVRAKTVERLKYKTK